MGYPFPMHVASNEIQMLFETTRIAFEKAPIRKYAQANGLQWNYSISSTRLTEGTNLIVGFNWGVDPNLPHPAQTEIPDFSFKELYDKKELGSLQRIYLPLKERFREEEINNSVQTNFCFFRSRVEAEITVEDLALSTPLFLQLISIIKPKRILGFSKRLQRYCIESNLCSQVETASFPSNKRTLHVAKGFLKQSDGLATPIFFLPHPNAKFTSIARKNGWDFCFGQNEKI